MRSPKDMGIIEIDITNACIHECSNCTRFCGHHKRPFFMSFEDFKRAVDSLEDFSGMIGIMGGEPTLHPEFERFVTYVRETRMKETVCLSRGPIYDMQFHIKTVLNRGRGRAVLLSSLSKSYYKHFELINDTFPYQILNDHTSESVHQALLMGHKELGIDGDEWIEKRDHCWIQNSWSASITPKGAFFCEVAGALDMLFDGPGGWKVESGWYRREPKDFKDQLQWCEMCSGCIDAPKRLAHEEIDDVTPLIYERLVEQESPKAKKGGCVVRDPQKYSDYRDPTFETGQEYIKAGGEVRISKESRTLHPQNVRILSGKNWRSEIKDVGKSDWLLIGDDGIGDELLTFVRDKIWNPGCLYVIDDRIYMFNALASAIRDEWKSSHPFEREIEEYYQADKVIYLSTDDELLFLLGGDTKEQRQTHPREGKKLLLFGAGEVGREIVDYLVQKGFSDFEIAVSDLKNNPAEVKNHPVKRLTDFLERKDEYVALIAAGPQLYKEMALCLEASGFMNYRFPA